MPGITKQDSVLQITQGLSVVVAVVAADEVDMVSLSSRLKFSNKQVYLGSGCGLFEGTRTLDEDANSQSIL
jgi:hypothetical protein